MKCPVCKEENQLGGSICTNCGFPQLHREFLNQLELERWMKDTVIPCQAVYKKMESSRSTLNTRSTDIITMPSNTNNKIVGKHKQEGKVLYDDNYVNIMFDGIVLNSLGKLTINCIAENKSQQRIIVEMNSANCNGWDLDYCSSGWLKLSEGAKKKYAFEFSKFSNLTDIHVIDEIKTFRYKIRILLADSCKTIVESDNYFELPLWQEQ